MRQLEAVTLPLVLALALALAGAAHAHDLPRSGLDIELMSDAIVVEVTAHAIEVAQELELAAPSADSLHALLAEPEAEAAFQRLAETRLAVIADGVRLRSEAAGAAAAPDHQAMIYRLLYPVAGRPARLEIESRLFPRDADHQAIVFLSEGGRILRQEILTRERPGAELLHGPDPGPAAQVGRFVASGIRHITLGPDHLLFVLGLLLLGGSLVRLASIVTAFTLAHSVTLTLTALGWFSPSPRLVEPAIALSLVAVGIGNLIAIMSAKPAGAAPDHRAGIAFVFGLVHGFGFASALREMGLPRAAMGWAIFSFNAGVELGQIAVVLAVSPGLALLGRRRPGAGRMVGLIGSGLVVLAGVVWFALGGRAVR